MAQKVITMDVKLAAALAAGLESVNVSALARDLGLSRRWVYELARRYAADGIGGLEGRSRRPKRSPNQVPSEVEDEIVAWRKRLTDAGLDAGPATIRWHLGAQGLVAPSEAGIWRVLTRRGLIERQPQKRPRSSYRRFEFARPNECWQLDAIDWTLADGSHIEVLSIIDDHSRLVVACDAVISTTTEAAWVSFHAAAQRLGLPGHVLSDNALAFSGKLRGVVVLFETNLAAVGVRTITSSPYHPQTCGKIERFHQTLKRWLRARPSAVSLAGLQHQLDDFRDHYNHHRPHRALRGRGDLPTVVWNAQPAAGPALRPLGTPTRLGHTTVTANGVVNTHHQWQIHVGNHHAGQPVTLIIQGLDVAIFGPDATLIRQLRVDPTRRYQRST